MNLNDFLGKLRARPERERERIAIVATGASFLIILAIWLVSFSETNRVVNEGANNSSIGNQLEELGKNAGESKQSIEEMMGSLPQGQADWESLYDQNAESQPGENQGQDMNQNTDSPQENQQEVPSLP